MKRRMIGVVVIAVLAGFGSGFYIGRNALFGEVKGAAELFQQNLTNTQEKHAERMSRAANDQQQADRLAADQSQARVSEAKRTDRATVGMTYSEVIAAFGDPDEFERAPSSAVGTMTMIYHNPERRIPLAGGIVTADSPRR